MTDELLEVLFPPSCVACDAVLPGRAFFCEDCSHLVLEVSQVCCSRCGEPGRFPALLCGRCTVRLPDFDCAWAPFEHDGAVATAIHRFKYEDHPELSRPLGMLLAQRAQEFLARVPGAVCPLPLHEARYRERKFDQATLLGLTAAKEAGRAFEDRWLTRTRATSRQVGLPEDAREENVRGAFVASAAVRGNDVILVDDVLTTGATAREAARALKAAGAKHVAVLTLARAVRIVQERD